MRDGMLMAQPFDNRRMVLTGSAMPVAERVAAGGSAFYASANDSLVFQRSPALQLTWYDRAGKVLGTVGEPADYQGALVLSPDGTRAAVSKRSGEGPNIWLLNLSHDGESTRFTFGSGYETQPAWSPDSSRIIFVSDREGPDYLYEKPVNGANDGVAVLKSSVGTQGTSWSRDGRFLLYTVTDPKRQHDIFALPLQGDKKPVPFLSAQFNEFQPHFSPDGHWVAYGSNESGPLEVFVRSFSANSGGLAVEAGGRWQISDGGGVDPRWRGDGRELFYRSPMEGQWLL